jgi:hypothetical protein
LVEFRGTVAEHLHHHPGGKGSSPVTTAVTGREKIAGRGGGGRKGGGLCMVGRVDVQNDILLFVRKVIEPIS